MDRSWAGCFSAADSVKIITKPLVVGDLLECFRNRSENDHIGSEQFSWIFSRWMRESKVYRMVGDKKSLVNTLTTDHRALESFRSGLIEFATRGGNRTSLLVGKKWVSSGIAFHIRPSITKQGLIISRSVLPFGAAYYIEYRDFTDVVILFC